MQSRWTLGSMNPIALIQATAATRNATLGALATDPVARRRTSEPVAVRRKLRSAAFFPAALRRVTRQSQRITDNLTAPQELR
jgi:hypothetical protein